MNTVNLDFDLVNQVKSPANFPEWFTLSYLVTKFFQDTVMSAWTDQSILDWRANEDGTLKPYAPCVELFAIGKNSGGSFDDFLYNAKKEAIGNYYVYNGSISMFNYREFNAPINDWEDQYLALYNAKYNTKYVSPSTVNMNIIRSK